jgi:enoyl-CoA hydratase
MSSERITTHRDGHVLHIGLHRADKRNAFDKAMLRALAEAYTRYEEDEGLRCAVLFPHGEHFTAGLDLAEVGPAVASGEALFPDGTVDPLGLGARVRSKPVVVAIRGWCLTIGIELALACDVVVADASARFGQIEINRGIFPFGGATLRLPRRAGWGNAMRWLLTGDVFDAAEAHRIGLVQEVVPDPIATASQIAQTIASRAPLGVRATLASAWETEQHGEIQAAQSLVSRARSLMGTEDAAEGLRSFVERREGRFLGR